MSSLYYVDTERELVLFRSTGRFTENDLENLLRSAYDDPRHTPHFNHLWDSRAIDELVVDVDVIDTYRELLDEYDDQMSRGKVAVVAARTLTRTFAVMLIQVGKKHPGTVHVFDDVEGAAEWIGVPGTVITDVPDHDWTEV